MERTFQETKLEAAKLFRTKPQKSVSLWLHFVGYKQVSSLALIQEVGICGSMDTERHNSFWGEHLWRLATKAQDVSSALRNP